MLKTDYSNDVFEGNRKYQITDNSDGTKSIEDVTTYTNEGDVFGAEDINATNKAVNGIMSSTADAYNPESTYSSGDYCIQNNTLYKANQDIDTPEEWTAGHWDATTVAEELDLLNQKTSYNATILEGDGTVYISKIGRVVYLSIAMSGVTLPNVWETKQIAQLPSGCIPEFGVHSEHTSANNVQCNLAVTTDGYFTIQPVTVVSDPSSGYIRCSFAYPAS